MTENIKQITSYVAQVGYAVAYIQCPFSEGDRITNGTKEFEFIKPVFAPYAPFYALYAKDGDSNGVLTGDAKLWKKVRKKAR